MKRLFVNKLIKAFICFLERFFRKLFGNTYLKQLLGVTVLHSKQTVKYICEMYPSGNCYYYKQEIITHDCWSNLNSLAWSAPRPVSKGTYMKQKQAGFKVELIYVNKPPAEIYVLR